VTLRRPFIADFGDPTRATLVVVPTGPTGPAVGSAAGDAPGWVGLLDGDHLVGAAAAATDTDGVTTATLLVAPWVTGRRRLTAVLASSAHELAEAVALHSSEHSPDDGGRP
jgi:hypothetical protein